MSRVRCAGLLILALLATVGPLRGQQRPFVLDTLRVSVDSRLSPGAGAVEVLDAPTLAALPVRTIEEALAWMTGIDLQARSPAQADVSIRGSTFEQILVLVDGVRMSDAQTGHFDLNLAIPLDRVERVEILRGPASAVYGADAVGGVINIVTRDGRGAPAGGTLRLQGGTRETWAAALDGTLPAGRWVLSGGASRDASDGHRDGTDYRVDRASARATGPAGRGRAVLDVGYSRRDFGAADFYAPFPSYEETRTTTAAARWVGAVASGLTLEPRLSYRRHEDDFILRRGDPDFFRNLHDSDRVTAEVQARLPLGPAGALALGGEWSRESLESTNLGEREEDGRAVYSEVALEGRSVRLQGGLRYDDRDVVGDFLSPSAALRWTAAPGVGVRASWGRFFRAPTWTERFFTDPSHVANPELDVERGWSGEVALELRDERGVAGVTLFRRVTEDLIDWARPAGSDASVPWQSRNVEEATTDGLELTAEGVLEGGARLQASASWLTLDARQGAGFLSKSALRPLHRVLTLRAILPLPDASTLTVLGADRSRIGGGGGFTLDLRLGFPLGDGEAFVDVQNATDQDYPDITGLPIPGRALVAGFRTPLGG
ncbi:MAG: TonB-dependent receptor [Longimicrobiales bacterium]|nr:TonB-dependent receptor [Longimicrobiales bacterium]